ncbi:MAG: polysulfide reductase NrfD, partial [Gemmatimonadetes bacterium]|nr:polysulfide reductase NrfD [Gemmatimonadota bacterium]
MQGYIYPNEFELHWQLLIVLYPYVTGLVAGAFILASLERVFNVKEVQPTYRLALLTALAFLLVAPLPLLAHLGHPERSHEIFLTPNRKSAMAMFGFVYAWYLTVVLLLEIWFEYRRDLVIWARGERGVKKWIHYALTLGSTDLSERALRFDDNAGRWITIIGIPSAFLLHGYVGFIFGSVKANPWWSSVLMPVVFLFSAIVSGIALVLVIYLVTSLIRWKPVDMKCADKLAS